MSDKALLAVGTFDFKQPHGLYTGYFDYETLNITITGQYDQDINPGNLCYDRKRNVLYVCDETEGHDFKGTGGGRIYAYKVSDDGKLSLINWIDTLMTKTCYCCLDKSGDHLFYANHTGRNVVTKSVYENGKYTKKLVGDDVGVGLISINEDGSLGEITDLCKYDDEYEDNRIRHSHCHSVTLSPDGKMFVVCDKGKDRIYTYHIENDKIVPLHAEEADRFSAPRYSVFEKEGKALYTNNETSNYLYAFHYDSETGDLSRFASYQVLDEYNDDNASDIIITNDGKYLYNAVRKANKLIGFRINKDKTLTMISETDTALATRGLCLLPDGRYLLAAYNSPGIIEVFEIMEKGELISVNKIECERAACMCVLGG